MNSSSSSSSYTHTRVYGLSWRTLCLLRIHKKGKKNTEWMKNFWFVYVGMLCVYLFGTDIHVTHKRRLVTTTTSAFLTDIRRYLSPYSHLFRGFSFFLLDYIFFIFLIIAWIYYYFTSTHVCIYKIQNPWSNQNNRVRIILACLVVVEAKWHTHTHNISVNIFVIPP